MPRLLKTKNGVTYAYSADALRKEFPHVSFPKDLSGVDLSPYDCVFAEDYEHAERYEPTASATDDNRPKQATCVSMPQFLYALREYNLRTQFERYILSIEGHARDYWFTAPYVNKSHTCVQHMAGFFALSELDLNHIFNVAASIEE